MPATSPSPPLLPRPSRLLDRLWRAKHRMRRALRVLRRHVSFYVRQFRSPPAVAAAPYTHDLIPWSQYYLSHHFKNPPSAMHHAVAALLDAASRANVPIKLNLLAPRASAKSTLVTLAHVLHEALEGREPYIWIISDTKRQAQAHLDNIYAELKDNNLLIDAYPRTERLIKSAGRIDLHDVCIEAYGTGQRIRGHRWHEHRPTLIICDDLQNDGHIRSAAQRARSRNWFHAMLMNAGTKDTKVINLGTALHREALAVELHNTPGWTSKRFQAIQEWPTNMHLWAEWEELYCATPENSHNSRGCISAEHCELTQPSANPDPEGIAAISRGLRSAATTPPEHEPTNPFDPGRVAAPDHDEPRWHPSRMQTTLDSDADRGCRSAQSPANRCDPSGIDLTSSRPHVFTPSSPPGADASGSPIEVTRSPLHPFTRSSPQQLAREFYDERRHEMEAGTTLLWPEHEDLYTLMEMRAQSGPAVFDREKQCIPMNPEECEWPASYFTGDIWFSEWPQDLRLKTIALDPSKGADARHGDYSAFVMFGVAGDNTIYIEANLARRPTPQIVTDGVALIKQFKPKAFGIEANQFQSLLSGEFIAALRKEQLFDIPWTIENYLAKVVRIRRLGPLLAAKRFRFKTNSPGTKMLVDQLQEFPLAAHDDGPDALEMALQLAEQLSQPVPNDGLGSRLIS